MVSIGHLCRPSWILFLKLVLSREESFCREMSGSLYTLCRGSLQPGTVIEQYVTWLLASRWYNFVVHSYSRVLLGIKQRKLNLCWITSLFRWFPCLSLLLLLLTGFSWEHSLNKLLYKTPCAGPASEEPNPRQYLKAVKEQALLLCTSWVKNTPRGVFPGKARAGEPS